MKVEFGSDVTSIESYLFNNCSGLTSVIIPDSVMSIMDNAFEGCTNLTNMMIGNGVTSIADGAFSNSGITSITIPNVTSIGYIAFNSCNGLTSMILPSVTSIRNSVFSYCNNLTSLTIGSSIQKIGGGAFATYGENPVTLTIGKTVTEVQAMGQTNYDWNTNVTYLEWGLPSGSTIVCINNETIPIE